MMLHFAHWFFKWFFTLGTVWSFVQLCKQMAIPFAPRTVVTSSGRRIRKGTVDNMLDGVGAVFGFACFVSLAVTLWIF